MSLAKAKAIASFSVPGVDYRVADHPWALEGEQAEYARRQFAKAWERIPPNRRGACFTVQILFTGRKPQQRHRGR